MAEGDAFVEACQDGRILGDELVVLRAADRSDLCLQADAGGPGQFVCPTRGGNILLEWERRPIKHHGRPAGVDAVLDDINVLAVVEVQGDGGEGVARQGADPACYWLGAPVSDRLHRDLHDDGCRKGRRAIHD